MRCASGATTRAAFATAPPLVAGAVVIVCAVPGAAALALLALPFFGVAPLTDPSRSAACLRRVRSRWQGRLSVADGATCGLTPPALVIGVGTGLLMLLPSLWFLNRLGVQRRLDPAYEPLDPRFRPVDPR